MLERYFAEEAGVEPTKPVINRLHRV